MSNEIETAQRALIADFELFEDWMDRYQYIIDLGKRLPEFPEDCKSDEFRIRGCQAQVWFVPEARDGRLYFSASSDAAIVSGLIAMLLKIYDGRRPADIVATPAEFVSALNLESHLSPTRSNGLASMLTAIQRFASEALEVA